MKKELKKQIEFLDKYGVTNYSVENDKIVINGSLFLNSLISVDKDFLAGTTINGYLDLSSLTSVDKDFLAGTTINGSLYLSSLTSCHKDFLAETTINGSLDLNSLSSCNKDFLAGTTINGSLYLSSLTSCHKDFLAGTIINGCLYLWSLTSCDKDFLAGTTINGTLDLSSLPQKDRDILNSNVKRLEVGYNKEKGYCYFDRILSKVLSVKETKGYVIYETPFEWIAQKGEFTAHGKTVKKAIEDLEFKIASEKLKSEPIYEDTVITLKHYRLVTGACESGCQDWMNRNGVEKEEMTAKELLPLLEKTDAYGLSKFKQLIKF